MVMKTRCGFISCFHVLSCITFVSTCFCVLQAAAKLRNLSEVHYKDLRVKKEQGVDCSSSEHLNIN